MRDWAFDYTIHLGYSPPQLRPQFPHTAAGLDSHLRLAAELGFAGFLYPWALSRPADEVESVLSTRSELGLRSSVVIMTPLDVMVSGIWTSAGHDQQRVLAEHVRQSCQLADLLGSDHVGAVIMGAPDAVDEDPRRQWDAAVENVRVMADLVAEHGRQLALEPMNRLPNVVVNSVARSVDFIREVDRDNVGMIFDTGHVAETDGDLVAALDRAGPTVQIVQFADQPGRVEPGAGTLDLVGFAAELLRRGYTGLVDLEHGWLAPDLQGEHDGLERIHRFDQAVTDLAQDHQSNQGRALRAGTPGV